MAKSDLLVLQEMCEKDLDIRCSATIVGANTCKQGGHVIIGVDRKTIQDITYDTDKYVAVLYIANREQFFSIKEEKNS